MSKGISFWLHTCWRVSCVCAATCFYLAAQTLTGPVPPVTESYAVERLVQQALVSNADLLAARQQLSEAQGLLQQSAFRPNPAIEASYGTGAAFNIPALREFSVAYSHVFELGGKRRKRIDVSEQGIRTAQYAIADRERQLRAAVRSRFVEARAAQIKLEVVERSLRLNQDTLKVTEARVRQGEAARLEQGLAAVEVSRLESERTLLASQVEQAIATLKPIVGMALDSRLRLSGDIGAKPPALDLATALTQALANRPDLLALRRSEEMRIAALRAAHAEAVPNVVGTARYTRTNDRLEAYGLNASRALIPIQGPDQSVSLAVSIILPIRNRNQGNIRAAEARRQAASQSVRFVEEVIRSEVTAAFNRYEAAQKALNTYDQQVLQQAQDNVSILQAAYTAGEVRLFDVLNEERRLIDTQRVYADVRREYYLALVNLSLVSGE